MSPCDMRPNVEGIAIDTRETTSPQNPHFRLFRVATVWRRSAGQSADGNSQAAARHARSGEFPEPGQRRGGRCASGPSPPRRRGHARLRHRSQAACVASGVDESRRASPRRPVPPGRRADSAPRSAGRLAAVVRITGCPAQFQPVGSPHGRRPSRQPVPGGGPAPGTSAPPGPPGAHDPGHARAGVCQEPPLAHR
jgi:hypothetical protein